MLNGLDASRISNIISESTNNIINQSKEFINSIIDKPLEEDTITVMINNQEKTLNKTDYELMKSNNDAVHMQMKADIKALINEFKEQSEQV